MPLYRCYDCSNVLCDDCFLKHDELTNTIDHTFQSSNDKMLLNNTFKVSNYILDMKALPGGLLVIVVYKSDKLLTYSVSDKQQHKVSVVGMPSSIAILDSNTVVVLLKNTHEKGESIEIIDIKQRHVITHVDVTLDFSSDRYHPMFYIDNQLYIVSHLGITVTDMSGTIDRKIDLGFTPIDVCYDTKAARIYCIDHSKGKLICIDKDDNTLITFNDPILTTSRRLTIDNEGYILILCHKKYNVRHFKIHRISHNGNSSEVIITGKQNDTRGNSFSSICFQEEADEVVIGIENSLYEYKNID